MMSKLAFVWRIGGVPFGNQLFAFTLRFLWKMSLEDTRKNYKETLNDHKKTENNHKGMKWLQRDMKYQSTTERPHRDAEWLEMIALRRLCCFVSSVWVSCFCFGRVWRFLHVCALHHLIIHHQTLQNSYKCSLHRNGEEWRADRLLLNKEVMMSAAVRRFLPLLDEVARDFCRMLRARVEREGRGEEGKRSLTLDPSPDLFRFALEGQRSSSPVICDLWCILHVCLFSQSIYELLVYLHGGHKILVLYLTRKRGQGSLNGGLMGTPRLSTVTPPSHAAIILDVSWGGRGWINVTSLFWQAFIHPNNQLFGLSHKRWRGLWQGLTSEELYNLHHLFKKHSKRKLCPC